VGLATINGFIHNITGVNMLYYTITDWLSIIPLLVVVGFGILGLYQWIMRKNLLKVDFDILTLGGFYIATLLAYLLFEKVVINYRPILINGVLEPSYPSSTTMLVMCVMLTSIMQFSSRIKNIILKRCVISLTLAFTIFMVVFRFFSGVHWFSDIIGGILLSSSLVMMYYSISFAN
ncbi:MAG: phosphatase PAP2 family protein, partial [Oscillospiraceae bacterium]|nr:phosphatase PAP2 family protein [Oscillospiraceae bacterium]